MMSAVMQMTQPGSIEKAAPTATVMPDTAAKRNSAVRRLEDQPGFVLHTYPYSESSVIVETFTRAHGRVPLLAKGAKRPGSTLRGALLQFQKVGFSWSGKGDLRNLVRAEWLGGIPALNPKALLCGFYLNELILKLLERDDPHERLFDHYAIALSSLATGGREAQVLRVFEIELLREIGYAVNLGVDAGSGSAVDPSGRYAYEVESGLRRMAPDESAERELSGAAALAIENGDFTNPQVATQAKHLMRSLIDHHLNGRRIATRQIFISLQQP
jgi:DNA repair protein RecO (recombination protein O)